MLTLYWILVDLINLVLNTISSDAMWVRLNNGSRERFHVGIRIITKRRKISIAYSQNIYNQYKISREYIQFN